MRPADWPESEWLPAERAADDKARVRAVLRHLGKLGPNRIAEITFAAEGTDAGSVLIISERTAGQWSPICFWDGPEIDPQIYRLRGGDLLAFSWYGRGRFEASFMAWAWNSGPLQIDLDTSVQDAWRHVPDVAQGPPPVKVTWDDLHVELYGWWVGKYPWPAPAEITGPNRWMTDSTLDSRVDIWFSLHNGQLLPKRVEWRLQEEPLITAIEKHWP